jgi:hypothetical protein
VSIGYRSSSQVICGSGPVRRRAFALAERPEGSVIEVYRQSEVPESSKGESHLDHQRPEIERLEQLTDDERMALDIHVGQQSSHLRTPGRSS